MLVLKLPATKEISAFATSLIDLMLVLKLTRTLGTSYSSVYFNRPYVSIEI